jgi:hypothetical protein
MPECRKRRDAQERRDGAGRPNAAGARMRRSGGLPLLRVMTAVVLLGVVRGFRRLRLVVVGAVRNRRRGGGGGRHAGRGLGEGSDGKQAEGSGNNNGTDLHVNLLWGGIIANSGVIAAGGAERPLNFRQLFEAWPTGGCRECL